ncbi:MAG TPA: GAF domain-containing sensor histidine kinase [Gemmatimonadales bacterium]|nr:GAF domain-containing sensor histidine kinase [Gemmatimonadales bacterium]
MNVKDGKMAAAKVSDDQRFLSNLAEVLASALDEPAMLSAVTRLFVPRLGDICLADIIEDDGSIQRVDNTLEDWRLTPTPALRAGESVLISELTQAALVTVAPEPAGHAAIRAAGIRSLALLPLIGRGRLLGVLTLAMTRPERRFTKVDLPFLEDIAQRTALGADNARLYQQARQASRARDDTLAAISHDLRNGLNTVLTAVSLLLRSLPPDTEGRRDRRHVEAIRRSAERMNRLIADLLDVASIESGRLFVEPRREPVRSIIAEALAVSHDQAAEKSLRVEQSIPAEPLEAVCDRDRVLQVLGNLISNAIKFTPEGGQVNVSAEPFDDEVLFTVRDTGIGVSGKQLPHIFDRFWQAMPKARLGSGLGLTIAKGVVEALGGRIWVESRPNEGTTFFFTLPLAAPVAATPAVAPRQVTRNNA